MKKIDWLIIFFIHEIQEYQVECDTLKKIISSVGPGKTNKILILLDSINHSSSNIPKFSLGLFEIADICNHQNVFAFQELTNTGINFKAQGAWKDAFRFIFSKYGPIAKRKILFTWSHGAGFGINTESSKIIRTNPNSNPDFIPVSNDKFSLEEVRSNFYFYLKDVGKKRPPQNSLKEIVSDNNITLYQKNEFKKSTPEICKNLEVLLIDDLANLLNENSNGKIDILVMMNCNMQLFENGFELRNSVTYYIAAESQMWAYGYDYFALLKLLNKKPKTKSKIVAKEAVSTFVKFHRQNNRQEYLKTTALFANNLTYYSQAFIVVEKIMRIVIKNFEFIKNDLIIIRSQMQVVSQNALYELLDLGFFLKLISERTKSKFGIAPLYNKYQKLNKKIRVAEHIGNVLIKNDIENTSLRFGHTGNSFFFPVNDHGHSDNKFAFCTYFSNVIDTKFEKLSSWDDLLKLFIATTKGDTNQHSEAP